MNLTSNIKIGLKVIMLPKVGTMSNWAPCIGSIFEISKINSEAVHLKSPEEAITKSAMISIEQFWDYFKLPSDQLEFEF